MGMDDPWGLGESAAPHAEPPEPLPLRLAKTAALSARELVTDAADRESPGPQVLPEVAALLAQGLVLLGEDPRWG